MSSIGKKILMVHLPDTRNVEISPYGKGNLKLGANVYTYSRVAGRASAFDNIHGTCPGSTDECEAICYAKRIAGPVLEVYERNSRLRFAPVLPPECKLLRIHVSGDFDTEEYIDSWTLNLRERPDVRAWAYTRSWRVPALLPALERLRALPNMQLFASMDPSTKELPPAGWRRAWIERPLGGRWPVEERIALLLRGCGSSGDNFVAFDGVAAYTCPEETKRKPDCESCRYCFDGQRNDVVFLEH